MDRYEKAGRLHNLKLQLIKKKEKLCKHFQILILLKQLHKDVQQYNLTGILFDDEVGDPTCIVDAMESVKSIYPTMQLGWTKSLGNAKEMNPSNIGKLDWNICLGQAYTDTTTNLYNGR